MLGSHPTPPLHQSQKRRPRRGSSSGINVKSGVDGILAERSSFGAIPMSEDDCEEHPEGPRYKSWPGRNVFCCGGLLMLGVHWKQALATLSIIVVCFIFFLSLPNSTLIFHCGVVLMFMSASTLIATACTDPGILPRCPASPMVDFMPDTVKASIAYCRTCHVVRAPRTKHCRHCDNCIVGFDHHCPWTGNCIGRRNYRSFFLFLLSTASSSVFVCVSCGYILWEEHEASRRHLHDNNNIAIRNFEKRHETHDAAVADAIEAGILATLLLILTLLLSTYLIALLGFHVTLLCLTKTTNEYLKGIPGGQRSFMENCLRLWCSITPPSLLLPMHEMRSEDDQQQRKEAMQRVLTALKRTLNAPDADERREEESAAQSMAVGPTSPTTSPTHYYQLDRCFPPDEKDNTGMLRQTRDMGPSWLSAWPYEENIELMTWSKDDESQERPPEFSDEGQSLALPGRALPHTADEQSTRTFFRESTASPLYGLGPGEELDRSGSGSGSRVRPIC